MSVLVMKAGEPKPLYGIPSEEQSIIGIPSNAVRVRLRFRNNSFAKAFVKVPNGIREYVIVEMPNGTWELGFEQGRNQRF